ncbi:hypothetical protein FRC19_003868 [Serendipita sp. 401]|nr:hypothetical protein FRC19_003868 [Serendipita sp. 401]KAG9058601.1 hypothetical protein FS842_008023 [Serendipita sp. 407]
MLVSRHVQRALTCRGKTTIYCLKLSRNVTTVPTYNQFVSHDVLVPPRERYPAETRHNSTSTSQKWADWNIVIGIEMHAQLKTRRKLFSDSLVPEHMFVESNERITLFDAAFPGTLPTLNSNCISLAIRAALALQAEIQSRSAFDRKHYFYGDLPVGYQITQNYAPFARNGHVNLPKSRKQVRIKQVQIEQDTAKSFSSGSERTEYDLNRAGMALLEIVSQPDMTSPEEAGEYVKTLQTILRSVGVSDGMMEAGSLRCDVNVSIHRDGEPLGTRTEIKNLNSVRSVVLATRAEVSRQIRLLTSTPSSQAIIQQTLTFDEDAVQVIPLRTKEGVEDYRYMPDPNLPNILIGSKQVDEVRHNMIRQGIAIGNSKNGFKFGIDAIRDRLYRLLDIPNDGKSPGVDGITRDIEILMQLDAGKSVGWDGEAVSGAVEFFENAIGGTGADHTHLTSRRDPKTVLNWMIHEMLGQLAFRKVPFSQSRMTAQMLGEIIDAVESGKITSTNGKYLLRHLLDLKVTKIPRFRKIEAESTASSGFSISDLIEELGLSKSSSVPELDSWCEQAMEELPTAVQSVQSGKASVIMALVGRVMRISKGKADAVLAKETLLRKIEDLDGTGT